MLQIHKNSNTSKTICYRSCNFCHHYHWSQSDENLPHSINWKRWSHVCTWVGDLELPPCCYSIWIPLTENMTFFSWLVSESLAKGQNKPGITDFWIRNKHFFLKNSFCFSLQWRHLKPIPLAKCWLTFFSFL